MRPFVKKAAVLFFLARPPLKRLAFLHTGVSGRPVHSIHRAGSPTETALHGGLALAVRTVCSAARRSLVGARAGSPVRPSSSWRFQPFRLQPAMALPSTAFKSRGGDLTTAKSEFLRQVYSHEEK